MTKGNKTASYTYDMSGVRSGKTVNGVSYEYTTLSGKITRMTWSGNAVDIVYDDAGRPYILRYTPQIVAGTAKIEYIATWFDDPHDSEMISFGYHLWDKR